MKFKTSCDSGYLAHAGESTSQSTLSVSTAEESNIAGKENVRPAVVDFWHADGDEKAPDDDEENTDEERVAE